MLGCIRLVFQLTKASVVVSVLVSCFQYIDENFGSRNQLIPADPKSAEQVRNLVQKIDSVVMFVLTFGTVVFHTERVTNCLRYGGGLNVCG